MMKRASRQTVAGYSDVTSVLYGMSFCDQRRAYKRILSFSAEHRGWQGVCREHVAEGGGAPQHHGVVPLSERAVDLGGGPHNVRAAGLTLSLEVATILSLC
jgi:hypothetical protein